MEIVAFLRSITGQLPSLPRMVFMVAPEGAVMPPVVKMGELEFPMPDKSKTSLLDPKVTPDV
jgi:hypothetical protein